jgi:hypothetical protein
VTTNATRLLLMYPPFADLAQCISHTAVNATAAVAAAPYRVFVSVKIAGSFATPSLPGPDTEVGGGREPWSRYSLRSCEATRM